MNTKHDYKHDIIKYQKVGGVPWSEQGQVLGVWVCVCPLSPPQAGDPGVQICRSPVRAPLSPRAQPRVSTDVPGYGYRCPYVLQGVCLYPGSKKTPARREPACTDRCPGCVQGFASCVPVDASQVKTPHVWARSPPPREYLRLWSPPGNEGAGLRADSERAEAEVTHRD